MQDYAHPESIVSTEWVAENKDNEEFFDYNRLQGFFHW